MADTLYGSDENHRVAAVAEVELVAPTCKGGEKKPLSEFHFDTAGNVTACPAGHAPKWCKPKKNAKYSAVFELECCQGCPRLSECPVKLGKNAAYLNYSEKQIRLARRRAEEQTETFMENYRWRAGVEATMSEYDRLTGVKKLRVRGFGAVRFCAIMKAAGLNMLRAARVRRARAKALAAKNGRFGVIYRTFTVFKERIQAGATNFESIFRNQPPAAPGNFKLVA
ncbi:MAG: transposase [Desulfobacterales bacterium]